MRREVKKGLESIDNLVGFSDNQLNLMKDIFEKAYNLGFKYGKQFAKDNSHENSHQTNQTDHTERGDVLNNDLKRYGESVKAKTGDANTNKGVQEGCGKDLGDYFCGNMGFSMEKQIQEILLCNKCKDAKAKKGVQK